MAQRSLLGNTHFYRASANCRSPVGIPCCADAHHIHLAAIWSTLKRRADSFLWKMRVMTRVGNHAEFAEAAVNWHSECFYLAAAVATGNQDVVSMPHLVFDCAAHARIA